MHGLWSSQMVRRALADLAMPKFIGEVNGHFTMLSRVLQNQMLQKCLVPSLSAVVLRMCHASQALSALLGMHN